MARYNSKPGVDWNLIKADFDSGLSLGECVKRQIERGVSVTKHAIQKRRDKEGWSIEAALVKATERLPSVIAQATGQSISRIKTPETAQKILNSLRAIPNYAAAAAHANISRAALDDWRKEPEFQELCDQAIGLSAADDIIRIKDAGARDWKAAAYTVERNPLTKGEFAAKESGGTNIQVVLNVDRAAPETITVNAKAEKE